MLSVGIDLVEIKRIKKSMKNPRFCNFILGKNEYSQLEKRGFPPQSVAANFCAKEAFGKAMGLGLCNFKLHEVELLRKENGQPYLSLSGAAYLIAKQNNYNFTTSITHTKEYASCVVIANNL